MKKVLGVAALAAVGGMAQAGGIDRSGQGISTLFEPGELVEFTFGYVSPDVSGSVAGGAVSSGDVGDAYGMFSFAYKRPLNEKVDLAVILDQPFGANIDYTGAQVGYPFRNSTATLKSEAVTALARYHFSERFSLHGGLRLQHMSGNVFIPAFGNYTLDADSDIGVGYTAGVAYEIPDIALRAALTYNSEVSHDVDSTEGAVNSNFELTTPQSVNLDFQTGIAKDTLLMASVRWVAWDGFAIDPPNFPLRPLVSYSDDRFSYTLGIGRRFNEKWAGSVTLGYEPSVGGLSSNLSPTDGYKSIAVGASYTQGNMKISGGVRYLEIGDTTTSTINADFSGNSGWAAGLKVSYTF
jgi:long-chain fatty acid transport protein